MKTVTLRLDPITRITLIVIAAALAIIALMQLFPTNLEANPQIMDVNIAKILGSSSGELPVEVTNEVEIMGSVDVTNTVEVTSSVWGLDFWGSVDVNIAEIFGEKYPYKTHGRLPVDVD